MDKFSVLACMLIREASLKTKDSVYSMHLNFGGVFWKKKVHIIHRALRYKNDLS